MGKPKTPAAAVRVTPEAFLAVYAVYAGGPGAPEPLARAAALAVAGFNSRATAHQYPELRAHVIDYATRALTPIARPAERGFDCPACGAGCCRRAAERRVAYQCGCATCGLVAFTAAGWAVRRIDCPGCGGSLVCHGVRRISGECPACGTPHAHTAMDIPVALAELEGGPGGAAAVEQATEAGLLVPCP